MARMGKQQLTPEEEARNKILMRERDRDRKRMKRMNPEYRKIEQERDRDRKKARRANEAFRQLEKLRDKIRKDRKKGLIVDDILPPEYVTLPTTVEPEVIISDVSPQATQAHNPQITNNHNGEPTTSNASTNTNDTQSSVAVSTSAHSSAVSTMPPHMSTLNKGLLYPPHSFPHHPLPLGGVTLMPQFCHPILHQNIGAPLYPPNGIKQEYPELPQRNGAPAGNNNNGGSEPDRDYALIEPEIILQTSSDVITAPHHFDNHAHAHHMHQQHSGMFQHMTTQQAHLAPHMRALPPQTHPPPPPPPPTTQSQQQPPAQPHDQQQQQQQQMAHYGQRKNS